MKRIAIRQISSPFSGWRFAALSAFETAVVGRTKQRTHAASRTTEALVKRGTSHGGAGESPAPPRRPRGEYPHVARRIHRRRR